MLARLIAFFQSLRAYTRPFWIANLSELLERIAFYGTTSMIVLYLTKEQGLEEGEALRLNGTFGLAVYGLPVLSGFLADLLGYRRAMLLAYSLLAGGYLLVGNLHGYWPIAGALLLVAFGASLIKPTITGTVQKTCGESHRAVGFSIYYTLVNIGGFLGPNVAGQVADRAGLPRVFWLSAGAAVAALLLVALLFREPPAARAERRSFGAFLGDFGRVITNLRLVALFLCAAGFWSLFFLFYGPLATYVVDDLQASKATYTFVISLDAAAVVACQVGVGWLTRRMAAARAVLVAIVLATIGIAIFGLYPSIWVVGLGVLVVAAGEMVYSAHFYKYLGDLAPPGQVGMYMGFAFLPIALGYFLSGQLGGLIAPFFRTTLQAPTLMWFAFAGVGVISALGIALVTRASRSPAA